MDMGQDFTANEVIKRWDARARQYADACGEYGDLNKEVLLTPVILELAGDVEGKRLLDAGCGEGFLSRLLAERGAVVTAVDYSQELLGIAVERTAVGTQVEYIHANLESMPELTDGSFDMVVSCAVLHDVPDYVSALQELNRVLASGGKCILAITHPCFSSDGAWVKDEDGKKLYWKIDNYFQERSFEINWPPGSDNKPVNFHRTLTSYFRSIRDAGFTIEDIEEPRPSQSAIKEHPGFNDDLRMSHFIVFKITKL